MTLKTTKLRDAIRLALYVGATTLAGTGYAMAQTTPAKTTTTDTTAAKPKATTLERVEVTGSRIPRVDVETSQPVFTLDRAAIQAQGLTSIGDVIQNLTANGSTLNTTFNNGGNGETRVSLRNLGSNRTLVLVNGRRWVGGTGLGGAVDLNTIPTAAVERIEVLKDGASSIYGSDAIAGVVNIILRKDFVGSEANAYYGQFDKGDGKRESFDFTIGSSSDRFSTLFGAAYVKEEPVFAGNRDISAFPIFRTGLAAGSSTTPNGRFALCFAPNTINPVTGRCSGTERRPNGTPGQFTYNDGQSGLNWRNRTGADLYNYAPDNYLLTPQERVSIFGSGRLDITDNLTFTAQASYNNRKSEQQLAANPVVLGSGPGAGVVSRTVSISQFSIYNPFGQPVSRIQRRPIEGGYRSFKQNVDTLGFTGAFEGHFELGDRYFTWDAGMTYARNQENDTTDGLFNVAALRSALGPSMRTAAGVPICVTTPGNAATIIPGCVPLNLLGAVGTITPEMLKYVGFVAHDERQYKMKQYFANVTGDIVELPAGTLSFAAGLEHRTEFGFDQPDALINSGNTTGNSRTATRGGYSLDEAYLELAIPILKDIPFARELSVDLATRYSDYSNFGNTTNSKAGFKWKPFNELLIRGNWSEGFRAPSIGELFSGVSDSFPPVKDPCANTFGGGYNGLDATQKARCSAQGVPVGGYDQGNSQIRISVGGNTNLQPETSITKTLGFVWSPEYVKGFDVSIDWWKIDLKNTVGTFGGQFILEQCILNGFQNFCNLYNRSPGGNIDTLLSAPLNFGKQTVEGYDLTLNYALKDTRWGNFSWNLDATYMKNNQSDNNADGVINAADGGSVVGKYQQAFVNNWKYRANLMTRWEKGDIGATLFTRYYSRQEETCPFYTNDYGFGQLCNHATVDAAGLVQPGSTNIIGGTTYHDVSFFWKAPWNAKITIGANNVFNKQPPVVFHAFANSFDPQYEVPGRFYYMQYHQTF